MGLGGNKDPIPHSVKGCAQFFFAVGVGPGCVEEGHAAVIGTAQQLDCGLQIRALDGQGAKGVLRGCNAGFTQGKQFHNILLFAGNGYANTN